MKSLLAIVRVNILVCVNSYVMQDYHTSGVCAAQTIFKEVLS